MFLIFCFEYRLAKYFLVYNYIYYEHMYLR